MVDLTFKMDFGTGFVTVPPPRNWKEMKIQLIFDQQELQAQLQSITFEWVKVNAVSIDTYIRAGLTGGTGIFEGIGLRIYGGSSMTLIFDGCINTADPSFDFQSDIIRCPIKESGKIDWMNDVAQSITFEYLTSIPIGSPGHIARADYKQIPYALSTIPDYTQAMMLSITLFIIIKESVDVTAKIVSLVVRAVSQSLSWLQLVGTIVEIILYLIYLVAIIVASAKLIQDIADNLLQPKKTKLGMREADLFIKGCEYFGLNFVSSIYGNGTADRYDGKYVNATLIPVKIQIPTGDPALLSFTDGRSPDETSNPQSYGYYEGTFKQFIDDMELTYNAKAIIRGNTLYFEQINNWNITNAFTLPNEGLPGNTFLYPQPYGTNASEIPAVYIIRFQKDDQDLNTYNDYAGTYVLSQAQPLIVHNKKNQLLSGATSVDLPFALAKRKVGYTKLERKLLDVMDQFSRLMDNIRQSVDHATSQMASFMPGVISAENVGLSNSEVGFVVSMLLGNPAGGVISLVLGTDGLPIIPSITIPYFGNDRIGWMLLSSDFIGVKKRLIGTPNGDDWYIHPNNSSGTYVTIYNAALTGTFTGTTIGVTGVANGTVVTGTVTAGLISLTIPTSHIGVVSGIVTGTISGIPGTYTANVNGIGAGGFVNATGSVGTVTSTSITTEGWGSSQTLLQDFHFSNIIDENQWLVFSNKRFKFGMKDFNTVNNNNVLKLSDGRYGKFKTIMWEMHNDIATDVTYRIKQKYTNNYKITTTTDGG